jgi:hypothetical protein
MAIQIRHAAVDRGADRVDHGLLILIQQVLKPHADLADHDPRFAEFAIIHCIPPQDS